MPKNIFSQMKEYVKQPNRNTFDLSFQNNLTMEFGKLYPVFVKDVIPGDSFRITPSFGLRFMPMAFPCQTKMQANLHFFYVRNRNLWKDWPDFIGRTKSNLTLPYLANPSKVAATRGLGDYMGLPTTMVGNYGIDKALTGSQFIHEVDYSVMRTAGFENWAGAAGLNLKLKDNAASDVLTGAFSHVARINCMNHIEDITPAYANINGVEGKYYGVLSPAFIDMPNSHQIIQFATGGQGDSSVYETNSVVVLFARKREGSDVYEWCARVTNPKWTNRGSVNADDGFQVLTLETQMTTADDIIAVDGTGHYYPNKTWDDVIESLKVYGKGYKVAIFNKTGYVPNSVGQLFNAAPAQKNPSTSSYPSGMAPALAAYGDNRFFHGVYTWTMQFEEVVVREVYDLDDAHNLYASSGLRVSALPFRAYESIYNAFYRNQQNDPFTINGVAEYNKFIPTNEGGADNTDYELRYRNWELDYLTSAVQSPQQGIAPLVGVTASGEFTFQNEDGSTFTAQATVGDDGDSITGIQIQSDADDKTPNGAIQTGTLRAMREIITNGISISDFRNVNALQRWLEVNMRRGFRYKDQLMSHFGVDAEYKELDMPEFIGGMSESVSINQVTQTSQGDSDNPLGSYAGQASILAQSKHSITHYCDEHGYIIGILSVSPVPNYSQLMPKHFIKHDTLDFFFPEFGHIGMQPLTYEEVCPIQSYAAGDPITDVFGYQRAWSDYIQSVDEVHGLMRTELRNFLINRQFDSRPELGAEFLHINPDDVNDVFTVTDATDKIVGAVWFDVQAKRPIPKFGIPRLEA